MSNKHRDLSLEDKVDLILDHQEKAIFWGRVKAVMSVLMFLVFVVIPIVWSYYYIRNLFAGVNVQAMVETFENLKAPITFDMMKDFLQ